MRSSSPGPGRGFTLVELLIVIVMLGILAAIVFPKYSALDAEARAKSNAANARKVRELIQIHRHSGEYPVNAEGNPLSIDAAWFRGGAIPEHGWTAAPFKIETVAGGLANHYPATKTYDPEAASPFTAWYNTDNGRFIVLVPPQPTDAETIALFNLANSTDIVDLGQTQ